METLNFARQRTIFDPIRFGPRPVTIVGLGGVGGFVGLHLMKHGVQNLVGYDPAIVKPENPSNQIYGPGHIGMLKADALMQITELLAGRRIDGREGRVGSDTELGEVVFSCVDHMDDRRAIMTSVSHKSSKTRLILESRIDANFIVLYAINPKDQGQLEMWEHYWFPQSEADNNGGCADPVSIGATASAAADFLVSAFVDWFANGEASGDGVSPNQVRIVMRKPAIETFVW